MIPRIYRVAEGPVLYVLEWGSRFHRWRDRDDTEAQGALLDSGAVAPAVLEEGVREGLWPLLPDWDPHRIALDPPLVPSQVGKVLALGKNFRAHAAEFGEEVPAEPLFFNKLPETLSAPGATVGIPSWYEGRVDHEAELAVVIGKRGKEIALEQAMQHVAGYTVANDLTARTLQKDDRAKQFPWFRGKNLDGFLPLGPCFVPRDALDPAALRVRAELNGELRQDARTADMVVDIPRALAYLSRHLTLNPGDIVLMGTPEGVGPLLDGDEVVCSVDLIGELSTRIVRR